MFDCGSVRDLFTGCSRFVRIARADFSPTLAGMIRFHSSGSDSQVGDKKEKKCKKGIRIYFANKTKVKNTPKLAFYVYFIW